MLTTTVAFEGNLAADPEARFTPKGVQLTELIVLVNERRQDEAGEWQDEEPTRHRVTCFGSVAINTADNLNKGDRVIVVGRQVTDSWTDKETKEKRTAPRVLADAVGASLRWASVTVERRPESAREARREDVTPAP